MMRTAEWLMKHSFFGGGFFQNMIHSGINAYLTLHIAQVLLRAGDPRATDLIAAVAELASPTGQWPEAIHPRRLGGCMGDGQHVWAAAEWVLAMRALFLREEGDGLVFGAGLRAEWLRMQPARFGPTATAFGPVIISAAQADDRVVVKVEGQWRAAEPKMTAAMPGFQFVDRRGNEFSLIKKRSSA
jgi:hypothetical protein